MNTNTGRWARLLLTAFLAVAFCCQCQSVRTVKSTRSSGYKFAGINDHELESNQKKSEGANRVSGTNKNERVIKNKKGEVVRTEKRDDLYSDRSSVTANETNKSFTGKKAKIKSSKYAKKEFKTPEYLKRQEFAGNKTFKDGNQQASESGSQSSFAERFFKTNSNQSSETLARESGSSASGFRKSFGTSSDKIASRAQDNIAVPKPTQGMSGYQDNVKLTMDDVKKLVNPSSYRPNG